MTWPEPHLKVSLPQGMILQISGSLPSLSGMEMTCDYGNNVRTVARVPGPAYDHQIAYCNLLPRAQFPSFPAGQGECLAVMPAQGWEPDIPALDVDDDLWCPWALSRPRDC